MKNVTLDSLKEKELKLVDLYNNIINNYSKNINFNFLDYLFLEYKKGYWKLIALTVYMLIPILLFTNSERFDVIKLSVSTLPVFFVIIYNLYQYNIAKNIISGRVKVTDEVIKNFHTRYVDKGSISLRLYSVFDKFIKSKGEDSLQHERLMFNILFESIFTDTNNVFIKKLNDSLNVSCSKKEWDSLKCIINERDIGLLNTSVFSSASFQNENSLSVSLLLNCILNVLIDNRGKIEVIKLCNLMPKENKNEFSEKTSQLNKSFIEKLFNIEIKSSH